MILAFHRSILGCPLILAGSAFLLISCTPGVDEVGTEFDPLLYNNEADHLMDPDDIDLYDPDLGGYRKPQLPETQEELIKFLIENIAQTSRSYGSPLGFEQTPISLRLLQLGHGVVPQVRQGFALAVENSDKDKEAALLACVLGRFNDNNSFEPVGLTALTHPSPDVRRAACWSIARIGYNRAIPILIELLYPHPDGNDPEIARLAASDALAKVTGTSFPLPVYHEEDAPPVAIWEDPEKWREWAKTYDASDLELPETITKALNERRKLREK
jgi:hypothetical protein